VSRFGFTTGSCSAAASKAAAFMLLTGIRKENISIETPKGITFNAEILDIDIRENQASCCVIKDGGDDPDVTTGAHVYSKVSYVMDWQTEDETGKNAKVIIAGGTGVGQVTKPGLDQPVGNAAINSVPREMIEKEVLEVMEACDYKGSLMVEISVPEGVELAKKTFNPRLGIVGGISILGTSGVVEPMSMDAIIQTIKVELNQKKAMGARYISVAPGNYGLDFMKRTFDFDLDKSVKCSNFIGDTIDMAADMKFDGMLLTGHIGKLAKLAGGMMNTHSKYGDCRMEQIASSAMSQGADVDISKRIMECVVTEDAVDVLIEAGLRESTMEELMRRIMHNINKRSQGQIAIECILYSNKHGILACSENAMEYLESVKIEAANMETEDK